MITQNHSKCPYQYPLQLCLCLARFSRYSASNNCVTLKSGLQVVKVNENDTIRKLGYGFLFAFHGSVLCHFRNKARYWSKIAIFHTPAFYALHRGRSPRRILSYSLLWKTRMVWLPDGEKSLMVTFNRFDRIPACDGQTKRDGRTDEQASCDSIVRAMHNIAR